MGSTWGGAEQKPHITSLNYLDGTTQDAGGGSYFTLEHNGRVTLDIGVETTIGADNKKVIIQLPENIRPQRIIYFPTYQNYDKCGTGYVNTDGSITIQGPASQRITAIAQISYFSR